MSEKPNESPCESEPDAAPPSRFSSRRLVFVLGAISLGTVPCHALVSCPISGAIYAWSFLTLVVSCVLSLVSREKMGTPFALALLGFVLNALFAH